MVVNVKLIQNPTLLIEVFFELHLRKLLSLRDFIYSLQTTSHLSFEYNIRKLKVLISVICKYFNKTAFNIVSRAKTEIKLVYTRKLFTNVKYCNAYCIFIIQYNSLNIFLL